MKNFNIPGIQAHFELNTWILKLKREYPEYFYPNINFSSVYGNFQYCIWDGGRNFVVYKQVTEEQILDIKNAYFEYNIPIRLVFTNPILEKKHLYNRFCNLQLEIFHDEKNEIVVNSPLLEDYIKTNYPKYKFISSTTKRLNDAEKALKEINNSNYYQVCLDYDLNKNEKFLNEIPKELRNKCEFLINAICGEKCPERKFHYHQNAVAHLSYLKEKYIMSKCKITNPTYYPNIRGKNNNFSLEDLDKYEKNGYNHFKIEGRTFTSFELLLEYLYYLVKPEWHPVVLKMAKDANNILINSQNDLRRYTELENSVLQYI